MARAIILVLDSLGIGYTPDAERFGDVGADTLGHIASWCSDGNECEERRSGQLRVPNLTQLGLGRANQLASGSLPAGFETSEPIIGLYAACEEVSTGKDTPSGHWEMTGVPVRFDWGYFPDVANCFPEKLINELIKRADIGGILGNCHGSGTQIIERLGQQHMDTGFPICYTSADSVFQIAAHEQSFGLERLYMVCEIARELVDEYGIGRIIARPFDSLEPIQTFEPIQNLELASSEQPQFQRTGNRRDYTTPPHKDTLLDKLVAEGREVHSVGKIADIFAHRGITHKRKATGHDALFDATIAAMEIAKAGSLVFTNFVEFDQSFGHRRNVGGYAAALEHFDQRLPEVMAKMQSDDMLILTADHGCDPTWPGGEHTREHVPCVIYRPDYPVEVNAGIRKSFCDIGQSIASHLDIAALEEGESVFTS